MSGLSVAICMERSIGFERRLWMFEVHTVKEDGGEEGLGAWEVGEAEGDGRTREERWR